MAKKTTLFPFPCAHFPNRIVTLILNPHRLSALSPSASGWASLSAFNPPVSFTSPSRCHISYPHIPHSSFTQASALASYSDPTGVPKTISTGQSAQCSARILTPSVFLLQANCWVGLHWLYPGWSMLGLRGPPHSLNPLYSFSTFPPKRYPSCPSRHCWLEFIAIKEM